MNNFEGQVNTKEGGGEQLDISHLTDSFLGSRKNKIDASDISTIENRGLFYRDSIIEKLENSGEGNKSVSYNRGNKIFIVDEKQFTMREIVSARRLGIVGPLTRTR